MLRGLPASPDLDRVAAAALRLLHATFDVEQELFSHKTLWLNGPKNVGTNPLYSAAALIGILSTDGLGRDGARLLASGLDGLWRATCANPVTASTLGAALWALARAEDPRAAALVERIGEGLRTRRWSSMDLGLAAHGLAQAADRTRIRDRCLQLADVCVTELRDRYVPRAQVFRATSRAAVTPSAVLHAGMTSFASQVYPLHGLAGYAAATGEPVAREALAVAEWLVASQGPLGQWWWFYGTARRGVVEPYPAYSVHQDAMAYMALVPLEPHAGVSFAESLERGLGWVLGSNEIGTPLIDWDRPFFARAIQRRGGDADGFAGWSRRQHVLARLKSPLARRSDSIQSSPEGLEILWETRSYHLGWVLYGRSLRGS